MIAIKPFIFIILLWEMLSFYWPITNTWKLPGIILGLAFGAFGSGFSNSAVGKYSKWADESIVMVLAPLFVVIVAVISISSADFSLNTDIVPSPLEVKIFFVSGSKAAPSQPSPIGNVPITLPFKAFTATSNLLPH